jgi:hypothetical protein
MLFLDSQKYDLAQQLKACQSTRRRRGKVARLPQHLRDQINRMLDDGLPYKTIIEKLGEAGKHLNEDNLTNWRRGGFADYLKAQTIQQRAQAQIEAAADIARDTTDQVNTSRMREAIAQIAMLTYFDTLLDHGDHIANESLQKNPAKMITLMNSLCSMAHSARQFEKLRNPVRAQSPPAASATSNPPGRTPCAERSDLPVYPDSSSVAVSRQSGLGPSASSTVSRPSTQPSTMNPEPLPRSTEVN